MLRDDEYNFANGVFASKQQMVFGGHVSRPGVEMFLRTESWREAAVIPRCLDTPREVKFFLFGSSDAGSGNFSSFSVYITRR